MPVCLNLIVNANVFLMNKIKYLFIGLFLIGVVHSSWALSQTKKTTAKKKQVTSHKAPAKKKAPAHASHAVSQNTVPKALYDGNINFIENDFALRHFYEQLALLEQGKIKQVRILHIGDSHIQADFFTGTVRDSLQRRFGSAGRGLYFPYRTAGTNGPDAVKDKASEAAWKMKRCAFPSQPMPIGIMGITLEVAQNAYIDVYVREEDSAALFDELRVFSDDPSKLELTVMSPDGNTRYAAHGAPIEKKKHLTEYGLGELKSAIRIQLEPEPADSTAPVHLYGLQLNNSKAHGVQYNMIGVNGAKFSDYNATRYFFSQLEYVPADLIIVSLGTNEALSLTYAADSMYMALDQFYKKLRQVQPNSSILFTAPPDTYYQHTQANPHTAEIVEIERRYAIAHDCGFWDFYTIMGGLGSVVNWYKQGMGNKDLVHFLRPGYQKQGQLLYSALMNAYEQNMEVKK